MNKTDRLLKKVACLALSVTMLVGGNYGTSKAEEINIANGEWKSFSICTMEDHATTCESNRCWRHRLENMGFVYGEDFRTEGSIKPENNKVGQFEFDVVSTGWDGDYSSNGTLIANNPYGLTATVNGIRVEPGKKYTFTYEIIGKLKNEKVSVKHIGTYVRDGYNSLQLGECENITEDGMTELAFGEAQVVKASFVVPEDSEGVIDIQLAMGAFLLDYPDEVDLSGTVYVRDFSIVSNDNPEQNIVTKKWESFSVCTMEDHIAGEEKMCWRHTLEAQGLQYGSDFATEGSIDKGIVTSSSFDFDVVNTGWDGEYWAEQLVGDNPYGLKAYMEGMSVDSNAKYEMSFKISSTLETSDGKVNTKHVKAEIVDNKTKKKIPYTSFDNISADGLLALEYGKTIEVKADFVVPESDVDTIDFQLAMGALLYSFPEELVLAGEVRVRDFKIVKVSDFNKETDTNNQETTTAQQNTDKQETTTAQNTDKQETTTAQNTDKQETTTAQNTTKQETTTAQNTTKQETTTAQNTTKQAETTVSNDVTSAVKSKISTVKRAKDKSKIEIVIKGTKNAKKYEIKYSTNKKFSKKTTKTITSKKNKVVLKKLKKKKVYYIKVRSFTIVNGKKKYTDWSVVKKVK